MARARNIKPGFFLNPDLNDCTPHARLLFIGLWTLADKEGRLLDRPRHIRLQVLPSDNVDVDALLDELASRGFVIRYEQSGVKAIWVTGFTKHQNPHKNEVPSEIPAYDIETSTLTNNHESSIQNVSARAESISISISPILNPEPIPSKARGTAERFEEFWVAYPSRRKGEKPQCRDYWLRHNLDGAFLEVMDGLQGWMDSHDWKKDGGQFIKAPLAWLRGEFWKSPPVKPKSQWSELNDVEPAF